jgi:hypothetical protein
MMNTYMKNVIRTAREFDNINDLSVLSIARVRTEREENQPSDPERGNNYIKAFSHLKSGKPVFKWENWGLA